MSPPRRHPTEEPRTAATMRALHAALDAAGLVHIPPPGLEAAARDDDEVRALDSLGRKRRWVLDRVLHHIAEGAEETEAKQRAARDCKTSVDAINTMFSELDAVAKDDS